MGINTNVEGAKVGSLKSFERSGDLRVNGSMPSPSSNQQNSIMERLTDKQVVLMALVSITDITNRIKPDTPVVLPHEATDA